MKYFPQLTGYRFIAAFLVFLFHYNPFPEQSFLWSICKELYIGVSLFFVLSGFLIAYLYLPVKMQSAKVFKVFLGRRFARIYPLFFILTVAYYVFRFVSANKDHSFTEIFLNLTLLKGFSDKYLLTGVMQAWSLTVEETFYLLSPIIFFLIREKRIFWLQLPVFFITGILLVVVFEFLKAPFFERMHFMWFTTFFGRCTEFFLGILLARQMLENKAAPSRGFTLTIAGTSMILICILIMSFLQKLNDVPYSSLSLHGLLINNFLLPFSIYLLLRGLLVERTYFSALLATPAVELMGRSSYAFYLLHAGIFAEFLLKFSKGNIFFQFLLVQILSIAAFRLFEQPVNMFMKRRFFNQEKLPGWERNEVH